mgnify:CR=1 FL=1
MFDVLSEVDTIRLCQTHSVARFGDGELRVAIGGKAVSQKADAALAAELRAILRDEIPGLLVGVPNFDRSPRAKSWAKYREGPFARLYTPGRQYVSSLITRPDSAPWIDTPTYWQSVRDLWAAKDVVLVAGDRKSITPEMLVGAASVRVVRAPPRDAYAEVERIDREIGSPTGVVIMCLGCTATALAARLHKRGVHALDLGHIGMFMKHAGAYQFERSDLASEGYRAQLREKHAGMKWGKHGHSHAPEILEHLARLGGRSVLDYGCGQGTLARALPNVKVFQYDPGIAGLDDLPKPADVVACTDVLEHVEPDLINRVLRHIFLLAGRGAYLVIATRLAREQLPDGRNAHLIVRPPEWWIEKLRETGWTKIRSEQRKGLCVWLEK